MSLVTIIDWILRKLFRHVDIVKDVKITHDFCRGCGFDRAGAKCDLDGCIDGKVTEKVIYLRRFFIYESKNLKLYLHNIKRSDDDPDPHDHPWDFTTFVISGGYVDESYVYHKDWGRKLEIVRKEKLHPGSITKRKAEHIHQVKLFPGRDAWTLCFIGPHRRKWGFWKQTGFVFWREYLNFHGPDPFDNENLK